MKKLTFLWLGLIAAASAGIFFLSRSLLTVLGSALLAAVFFVLASALILLIGWNTDKPSVPKKRHSAKTIAKKKNAAPALTPEQEVALAAKKAKAEVKAARRAERRAGLKKTLITSAIVLVSAGMIFATVVFVFDPFSPKTQDALFQLAYDEAKAAVTDTLPASSSPKFINVNDATITFTGSSYYVSGWVTAKNESGEKEKLNFTVYLKYSTQQKTMTVIDCDLDDFSK